MTGRQVEAQSSATDWQIRHVDGYKPARWEVFQNGRRVWDGSYDDCEQFVQSRRGPSDTVIRIEPDGYRWDLTRQLR